jgi:phage FluMu protein Com
MTIAFQCSGCGVTLKVPDTSAGRRGKCPKCATVNLIPAVGGQVQTAPPTPRAAPRAAKPAPAPDVPDEGEEAGAPPEPRPRRKGAKKRRSRMMLFVGLGCGGALLLLCLGVGAGVGIWWYTSSPIGDELTYMPGNCEVLASIRVDQLLASDAYKQIEKEVPQLKQAVAGGDAEKEMGLQLSNIERVVIGGALGNRDKPVVVVRTKQAVKAEDMVGKIKGKSFTGTKVGSYTLYESGGATGDGFCVAKKNLVLFGTSAALRLVLQRDKKPDFPAGLSAAMKEADFSKTIAVAVAPLQTSGAPAPPLGGFPMGGAMAFGQSKEVDGVVIQAKVASDISLSFLVLCKDAATATATKKKLDEELPKLKTNPMVPADLKSALDIKSSVSGRKLTATMEIKVAPLIKAVKNLGPLLGGMGGK